MVKNVANIVLPSSAWRAEGAERKRGEWRIRFPYIYFATPPLNPPTLFKLGGGVDYKIKQLLI